MPTIFKFDNQVQIDIMQIRNGRTKFELNDHLGLKIGSPNRKPKNERLNLQRGRNAR